MAPSKASQLPNMQDVFKTSPNADILDDLLSTYRNQAKVHLQETIPAKIKAIQGIIASENDPSSILWLGHLETPAYNQVEVFQPDDPKVLEMGLKTVLPSDITRARGNGAYDHPDDVDEPGMNGENGHANGSLGNSKGVRAGPHWFEVMPINQVQDKIIKASNKEHEALHMIVQDLRIWLELEIPVIEDGNSFGADVQNHLIRELNEHYKRSNSFQNGCRAHYTDRVKLAQEWITHLNLMDYPAAIAASDRFDHQLMRTYYRSLLVIYGGLLTRFQRNWAKVINPKGSGSSGAMY